MATQARVIRMLIYEGPAVDVLRQVERSVHGTKIWGKSCTVSAQTMSTDIFDVEEVPEKPETATDRLLRQIRREREYNVID